MALMVTVIGPLIKDPFGSETYTMWKVRCDGREVAIFSADDSSQSRANFRTGYRIRGEGKGAWKEFNEDYSLTLSSGAVDGSDDEEDSLKIKVDGSIGHELEVQQDDEDEGGGRYIQVEIEAPVRGKNSQGDWDDMIAYVRGSVIGPAVDKLLELDKKGITSLCFSGDLQASPEFIKGEPAYYAYITDIAPSQGRGGDDDAFWAAKPRNLAAMRAAKKQSAPAAPTKASQPPKPAPRKPIGKGQGPDDPLPF